MRAAIYARYSSDLQREASIEDQCRLCRRLIAQNGWAEGTVYADAGISGSTHLRPGYQRLLHDARAGAFDVVVSEGLDRISRDQEHVAALHKLLSYAGIPLVTVAEGEISELHVGLKGTMSALFLKDLAQKTRRGLEGRVRAGKSAGGISYGYETVRTLGPDGMPTTGDRSIVPAEAATVRRIFEAFAAGQSPRAIAMELNGEGIPGPAGRAWGPSTIYGNWRRGTGILNNELYVGRLVWNRQRFVKDPDTGRRQARPNPPEAWVTEEVPDLRIIDDALWERVKARQRERGESVTSDGAGPRPERARRPRYLFSGLLRCGACGSGFVLVGKQHYGCAAARNQGTCANRRTIRRDRLERDVLGGLREQLLHPDLLAAFVDEYRRELARLTAADRASEISKRRELARVEKGIRRIIEAVKEGFAVPQMRDELHQLEARRVALASELAATADSDDVPVLHPGLAELYRRKVAELTDALSDEGRSSEAAEAIRALLQEIRLVPEGDGLAIELVGALAGILALGKGERPRPFDQGRQTMLVAGAGFEPATFRL